MSCCSTTTTWSRRPPKALVALAAVAALAGCSPKGPPGIDLKALDHGVADRIGDPTTCVLIVKKGSGEVVWRYSRRLTCAVAWPACDKPGNTTGEDLAKAAAAGAEKEASCASNAGGVGWAAGPVPTTKPDRYGDLAYAAVMSSKRALPGHEMAIRLEQVFADAGF